MDQIYARIKRLRNSPYRRVVSGERLFDVDVASPDSCSEYDPSTLLDDGEWYKISGFREREFCLPVLRESLTSADVPELAKDQFESIAFLMSVQDGKYFFQRVRPSALLRRKSIVFGDAAVLEEPSNRIVINPQPDAIYLPDQNALLFRELAAVSSIFAGIDALYKEATDDQVQEFLDSTFIASELEPSGVSKPNRKRIALALDTLSRMSEFDLASVFAYIGDYSNGRLQYDPDAGAFSIENDDDLKVLVYGIEQRFYTTLVGSEKRLANSIVRM
ncbi:ATP F0F1 synthase synthase [Plantibacter sp. T3]|uniref:ATP F0F1 synthase synthase n=1 Tax=Plantibacter sp. T3 TaxID=2653161 RepID=UPI0012F068BE|nr:ATP F0F1 synthase synthase [Plantibacter sp. T3]VXB09042.1 ATP F0F1 synthase synthase [Plantibacter sp. T3]